MRPTLGSERSASEMEFLRVSEEKRKMLVGVAWPPHSSPHQENLESDSVCLCTTDALQWNDRSFQVLRCPSNSERFH